MRALTVNVTEEQYEEVRTVAFHKNTSQRAIGMEAVEQYLSKWRATLKAGKRMPARKASR